MKKAGMIYHLGLQILEGAHYKTGVAEPLTTYLTNYLRKTNKMLGIAAEVKTNT